jgi:Gpi18-like mannosyltransferase
MLFSLISNNLPRKGFNWVLLNRIPIGFYDIEIQNARISLDLKVIVEHLNSCGLANP